MGNKVLLAVMDGIGLRDEVKGNAFKQAQTPNLNFLMDHYGCSRLEASGQVVGLPKDQMGNSEVGHMNIGAGRIVPQPLEYINQRIMDNTFFDNKVLLDLFGYVKQRRSSLHVMGLLSDGGVHSHIHHVLALLLMCKLNNVKDVYFHLFTDGRDTKVDSAMIYIDQLESKIKEFGIGKIATIVGRYYGMDRDSRWDRVEKAYDLMVLGAGDVYKTAREAIQANYSKNITDEFIRPSVIEPKGTIKDGDAVIHMNFRPDRVKEMIYALTSPGFNEFKVFQYKKLRVVTLSKSTYLPAIYNLTKVENPLGVYLSKLGMQQLRIAETEKYAHVTYFFDGGVDTELPQCKRILIPSPKVPTYDLTPRMSADVITRQLVKEMELNYRFILVNYANGDMVGHTGNLSATIKAVEAVDENIGVLYKKAKELGYTLIIIADHGNAEEMVDGQNHLITSHTKSQVPFIVCDENKKTINGKLGDVAPTILNLLKLPVPKEMTGKIIVK